MYEVTFPIDERGATVTIFFANMLVVVAGPTEHECTIRDNIGGSSGYCINMKAKDAVAQIRDTITNENVSLQKMNRAAS